MPTPPYNPFYAMVREHVAIWKDATTALDVDRKTFQRWLAEPDRITIGALHRMATIFQINETELVAAAIATITSQRREELRQTGFVAPQVVDFFGSDNARKMNPNCN